MEPDLIQRCEGCNWCPFEIILKPYQRTRETIKKPLEDRHPNRRLIEEICGKQYGGVCEMKYAIMRSGIPEFNLAQIAMVIKNYCWDHGKKIKNKVNLEEAFELWAKRGNLGRGHEESYASRFREIWDLGLRKFPEKEELRQSLGELSIYETVVSDNPQTYNSEIEVLQSRKIESNKRDKTGISH